MAMPPAAMSAAFGAPAAMDAAGLGGAGAADRGATAMGGMVMMANPMMSSPMLAGPMMMANPMMAMMMSSMCGMQLPGGGPQLHAQGHPRQAAASDQDKPVDPQIRDLCRTHNIEERLMRKLSDAMMRRDTFEDDLQTIREKLSQPRPDVGVIIRQLEQGSFVSKNTMHRDIAALVERYQLDDRATHRLIESMGRRRASMKEDLRHLDVRLASAERPSGLLMTLLQGLDANGELPPPPRSLGLTSSFRIGGAGTAADRDRDRERRDRRDRSRSRSGSRSRRRR